jgi:hypothetical protein
MAWFLLNTLLSLFISTDTPSPLSTNTPCVLAFASRVSAVPRHVSSAFASLRYLVSSPSQPPCLSQLPPRPVILMDWNR